MAEIAFAAGFASIRTFNDTVREVFALSPSELRERATRRPAQRSDSPGTPGVFSLRLPFRAPLNPDNLFGHLAATAVPGVEEWRDGAYRRTLRLPYGHGVVAPHPGARPHRLPAHPRRPARPARRHQPLPPDARPGRRPGRRRRAAARRPACSRRWSTRPRAAGCRAPSTRPSSPYGPCSASRSPRPRPARTRPGWSSRTANRSTTPRAASPISSRLPRHWPAVDPETLAMPRTRRTTFTTLVEQLADGTLHLGVDSDWAEARARLLALPGFGPWTVDVIAMRALGDPDAFLPTRPRNPARGPGVGPAVHPGGAHGPRGGLAALAGVRGPVPVGDRQPPDQLPPRIRTFQAADTSPKDRP